MRKQIGKITRLVVAFTEYGDSVDGKPRVLDAYESMEKAQSEVEKAAFGYRDALGLDEIKISNGSASVGSTDECGCEYRIDEVEIPVYEGEMEKGESDEKTHRATIEIPSDEIMRWNELMEEEDVDFESLGFRPHDNVAKWTAKFDDGHFVDVKVNTGEREMYAEAVLFDACGSQVAFSHEAEYELDGPEWILYAGEDEYHVQVMGKREEK